MYVGLEKAAGDFFHGNSELLLLPVPEDGKLQSLRIEVEIKMKFLQHNANGA